MAPANIARDSIGDKSQKELKLFQTAKNYLWFMQMVYATCTICSKRCFSGPHSRLALIAICLPGNYDDRFASKLRGVHSKMFDGIKKRGTKKTEEEENVKKLPGGGFANVLAIMQINPM